MTLSLADLDVEYARFNAIRTIADARPSEFTVDVVGPLTVTSDPAREDGYYNRVLGLDEASLPALDAALERVTDRAAVRVDVAVEAPPAVRQALQERGFEPGPELTWLQAISRDEPTSVPVIRWGPDERDRLLTLLDLEGPVDRVLWSLRREHYATDTFRAFAIEIGGEAVAMATTFIGVHGALLGNAVTRPDCRGRGYQSALVAARLQDARNLGVETVVTDVEPDTTSLRNCQRLGFDVYCEQTHWERRR